MKVGKPGRAGAHPRDEAALLVDADQHRPAAGRPARRTAAGRRLLRPIWAALGDVLAEHDDAAEVQPVDQRRSARRCRRSARRSPGRPARAASARRPGRGPARSRRGGPQPVPRPAAAGRRHGTAAAGCQPPRCRDRTQPSSGPADGPSVHPDRARTAAVVAATGPASAHPASVPRRWAIGRSAVGSRLRPGPRHCAGVRRPGRRPRRPRRPRLSTTSPGTAVAGPRLVGEVDQHDVPAARARRSRRSRPVTSTASSRGSRRSGCARAAGSGRGTTRSSRACGSARRLGPVQLGPRERSPGPAGPARRPRPSRAMPNSALPPAGAWPRRSRGRCGR